MYRMHGLFRVSPFLPKNQLLCSFSLAIDRRWKLIPSIFFFILTAGGKKEKEDPLLTDVSIWKGKQRFWLSCSSQLSKIWRRLLMANYLVRDLNVSSVSSIKLCSVWISSLWGRHWYFPKEVLRSGDVGFDISPTKLYQKSSWSHMVYRGEQSRIQIGPHQLLINLWVFCPFPGWAQSIPEL